MGFVEAALDFWLSESELILGKMLGRERGGTYGNSMFPGFVEENSIQYDNKSLPQLQLFAHVPNQCGVDIGMVNCPASGYSLEYNLPINRFREGETQKNSHSKEEKGGHCGDVLNLNPVSTGLKLSCNTEEPHSSITYACENAKSNLACTLSNSSAAQIEIDRQTQEFVQYMKYQEESMLSGIREINRRHTVSLLNTLEKGINKKLHEKDLEIESITRKNKELGERIKQVTMEAQSWHCRAKYNESVIDVLKSNIQQLMAQGNPQACEGCGDSEVDDAASCSSGNQGHQNHLPKCRACNGRAASVLILPCRHLCLCTDCEGFVDVCPLCRVMKTTSVHVYM